MIETSDVVFFLIGFVAGGGIMRWLAWHWYAAPVERLDLPPDLGRDESTQERT